VIDGYYLNQRVEGQPLDGMLDPRAGSAVVLKPAAEARTKRWRNETVERCLKK
jgi:hypothetical protein